MKVSLRRYTELPYVVDFLQSKKLTLVSPVSWDDRNDSYYIEQFARIKRLASTYALCLAEAPETYHHWRVFSHGSSGACIVFDRDEFIKSLQNVKGLRAAEVQYKTINQLQSSTLDVENLPFLKRQAYVDEKEFRLFRGTKKRGGPTFQVPVPLKAIEKITLSPWLPRTVAVNVKKSLQSIEGCSKLSIKQSTLIDNESWKEFATNGM